MNTTLKTFIITACLFLTACSKNFDVPQSNRDAAMADPRTTINLDSIQPGLGTIKAEFWDIGTGINGYVWHAPNAKAVLLFHAGYSDYPFRWVSAANQLIPHLLSQGITVYALDPRGHGYTQGEKGLLDVEQGVSDHIIARGLLKQQPLPVFVFGHSLGGLITTSSMAQTQDGLAGAIIVSAALHYNENNIFTRFFTQSLAAFASGAKPQDNTASDSTIFRGALTDPAFQNDKLIYRGDIPVKTLSTTLKFTKQNPGYYNRITIPVLIIHGTQDENTEIEGSQLLYDGIHSTDKTFQRIEGAYHSPLDDVKKDEVLNIILKWLKDRI